MSQTLTSLLVHLVFSTKNRERLITPEVEPDLFAYIGGILSRTCLLTCLSYSLVLSRSVFPVFPVRN
jgi:hypothetical protein